ncbi:DNA polymerase II small subunit [Anopheles sinensis]|uniref:DNA polymerase II small subunit n=1 Tax=Anopheles sinensis TaxID=74873 RepID=A0A084WQR2_ANOSI|nr:DNA polymerase II small subunit [Anopheles sinensis]
MSRQESGKSAKRRKAPPYGGRSTRQPAAEKRKSERVLAMGHALNLGVGFDRGERRRSPGSD